MDKDDRKLYSSIEHPVLVWWSSFTSDKGSLRQCGPNRCFVTIKRKFKHHAKLKAFLFYGTHLKLGNLPLPKLHDWALFHEESPKNNRFIFSNEEFLSMFNYTSTFRRESDMPLTTFHLHSLDSITSTKFFKATEIKNEMLSSGKLSLVAYIHSDCDVPSDRDNLMLMIQNYIQVDSYGTCLHNKELPERLSDPMRMNDDAFFEILSYYKFVFATENVLCSDYTTEKFWRAIEVGSVPIVLGSDRIKDLMPHNKAAILVKDYETVKQLADHLIYLSDNDDEYEKYLIHKTQSKITNSHLVQEMMDRSWHNDKSGHSNYSSEFECMVCNRIHENIKFNNYVKRVADKSHYGCPRPTKFSNEPAGNLTMIPSDSTWALAFDESARIAKAFQNLLSLNRTLTRQEIIAKSYDYY
ncbi:hypothetical protein HELRODRAFT_84791 [Helobdella robusta]|uniref:Fucosyltransferase n=1 Tax=Helobdella robusta TaxID=6412 RepID=T1G5N7_HELRO|nr:hypothetical protein HELRODRAFT_84791 [Helobdella robusta]ESN98236.1 hypothetical protein HELRODRAFT_84791 [Helobdella robusta]